MAFTYGSNGTVKLGNGETSSYYQCRLGYQVNSQNIENNSSNVTLRLEVRSINSSYATYGYKQTSTIDGVTLGSKTFDMSNTNTWQVFGERTITLYHNAEGKYSASKSASFTTTATGTYSLKSGSASVTVTPANIARASQPSLVTWPETTKNVTIGNSITIHMNRVSDSFTHTVRYSWYGLSGTIATNVGDNCDWTIPMDLCNQIPSSTSGAGTVYVDTYSNGKIIGTKSVDFTGLVPDSVKPNISAINITEGNTSVSAKVDVFVQGRSQLHVVSNTAGSYGSWITSCKVEGIDNSVYWSTEFVSGILQSSGSKTITVTVTDSRGRTASRTANYNCVAYSNPTISISEVIRCNSDGTVNEEGAYVKYSFKADISPISNKNYKEFRLGYKKNTDANYTYIQLSNTNYSLNVSNVIISGVTFSADYSYDFEFMICDHFTPIYIVRELGTGFTLFDINASGKGFAFGKVSEKDALEIALPTEFEDLTIFDGYTVNNKKEFSIPITIGEKYGWYLALSGKMTGYNSRSFILSLQQTYAGGSGLIYVNLRCDNGSTLTVKQFYWLSNHTISSTNVKLKMDGNNYYLYLRTVANHQQYHVNILGEKNLAYNSYGIFDINAPYYEDTIAEPDGVNPTDNFTLDGIVTAKNGFKSLGTGYENTQTISNNLIVKEASAANAPNNGIILEYGGSSGWGGQLYIGDNATQGIYFNGWSNGARGEWKRLMELKSQWMVDNTDGNNSHIFIGDLLICWGRIKITPTAANTPTSGSVTFPRTFGTVPTIVATPSTGVPGTQCLGVGTTEMTTTGFKVHLTRTNTTSTSIDWIAIGRG